ncbi:MAG: exosortase system-associated protein, TIGR04073 family [Candidatus Omnitrophota bacterium]
MKKFALFLVVVLAFSSTHAEAAIVEEMNSEKALTKFSRGVTNVATSPGEFVAQIPPAMEQSPDYLTGFIMSIGRGIGYTFLRFGAGIYDIATFPFPGRTDYKPVMEPETIADKVADTTIQQSLPTV